MFVFNVPPTAKVILGMGAQLKVSSNSPEKLVLEPAIPGLQGEYDSSSTFRLRLYDIQL